MQKMEEKKHFDKRGKKKEILTALAKISQGALGFSERADDGAKTIITGCSISFPVVFSTVLLAKDINRQLMLCAVPVLIGCMTAICYAIKAKMVDISENGGSEDLIEKENTQVIFFKRIVRISLSDFLAEVSDWWPSNKVRTANTAHRVFIMLKKAGIKYQMMMVSIIAFISGMVLSTVFLLLMITGG